MDVSVDVRVSRCWFFLLVAVSSTWVRLPFGLD